MTSTQDANVSRLYPEVAAGGFSHVDGTISFYTRVNALLKPHHIVLDLGAGRGAQLRDDPCDYRRVLARIQGKVQKVVGVDVDSAVFENRYLDQKALITIGEPYPFEDDTFDLILSDWVLEHVDNPAEFSCEVERLLKPGGWFCARTPNRWGMIGLIARLVPNSVHARLVSRLQANRETRDVFPTRYRLNSKAQLRSAFPPEKWEHCSYLSNAEPPYVQRWLWAMHAVRMGWRFTPRGGYTALNVFLRLKG